jgi:hypothetical protein
VTCGATVTPATGATYTCTRTDPHSEHTAPLQVWHRGELIEVPPSVFWWSDTDKAWMESPAPS